MGPAHHVGRRRSCCSPGTPRHFAWHAELWDGVVPVLHDRPEASVVTEPTVAGGRRGPGGESTEPEGVYDDVLPHVVAAYRGWSGESTPIAERPVMRVLDLVLHDLDFDAQEGHDLLPVELSLRDAVPGCLTRPVS